MKGIAEIWQIDKKTNKIKKYIKKSNLILTQAKHLLFENSQGKVYFKQIGIGTDNTAPDASQTGLLAEERLEDATISGSDNQIIIEHTFSGWSSPPTDITEAGTYLERYFNFDAYDADYFNRVTFDPVTCDENNNIKIKFTITID